MSKLKNSSNILKWKHNKKNGKTEIKQSETKKQTAEIDILKLKAEIEYTKTQKTGKLNYNIQKLI